ncbi:MAG TPA: alpha/beta hydrolase-fold protein [Mucilaginibacter sp.]|nr:alpha/beta hydrolase-fold protein [Mucilaginibacter sp.]
MKYRTTIRYFYRLLIAVIVVFAFYGQVSAQIDSLPARNDTATLIKSKIMPESRTIWIHLPPDYNTTTNTYPVLYVLDGDSHFQQASTAADFLAGYDRDRIPEMIVVGITNVDRGRDLTPIHPQLSSSETDSVTVLKTSGAGRFLRYIDEEVIPYVDLHYRVAPYRILMGHSLAGLFALYVKETKPDLFHAMILVSPAIGGVNDHMIADVGKVFSSRHPHNGKLFITLGNENPQKVDALAAQLKHLSPDWFAWDLRKYDDENHFSVPYKSLFDGLKFIYKDWFIDFYGSASLSYQDMVKHFAVLSAEFGYSISPTEDFINSCGYAQLRSKHLDNAIDLFAQNVKLHPNSFNAYDSLGEAYMDAGNKTLAISNYKKSLELNPHNDNGRAMLKKLEGGKK